MKRAHAAVDLGDPERTTMSGSRPVLVVVWAVAALLMLSCGDDSGPGGSSASPTSGTPATATSTPTVPPNFNAETILKEFPRGGGPKNQVRIINNTDGRFVARASVVLRRLEDGDPTIDPQNIAVAEGRCTDCQTIAVALQVVLYQRGSRNVQPQNIAIALNANCTRCVTVARAIQYVIPVDDPKAVPDEVVRLVKDMDHELQYFSTIHSINELDPDAAVARLNQVMAQYADLNAYLTQLMDVRRTGNDPSASPSAAPSPAPTDGTTPAPSPTAGTTPVPSPSDGTTPAPSPTDSTSP